MALAKVVVRTKRSNYEYEVALNDDVTLKRVASSLRADLRSRDLCRLMVEVEEQGVKKFVIIPVAAIDSIEVFEA